LVGGRRENEKRKAVYAAGEERERKKRPRKGDILIPTPSLEGERPPILRTTIPTLLPGHILKYISKGRGLEGEPFEEGRPFFVS